MSIENFRQLADYNHWANRRIYAAALDMPEEQYRRVTGVFFGSLHGTLNHLLLTDRVWLKRLTGEGEHPKRLDAPGALLATTGLGALVLALTLVGVAGTAVVVSGTPERQAVTYSLLGLSLGLLFIVLQAPDVALSQVAVGTAVMPMMILLATRTIRKDREDRRGEDS